MEIISRLKVKLSIAKRFRDFAKKNGTKNSEALELMIDFFERNNLSPFETLSPSKVSLENLIKKRIDGLIAILKNIEKTQIQPSFVILQILAGNHAISGKNVQTKITKKQIDSDPRNREELSQEIIRLQESNKASRQDLEYLLNKIEIKSNSFGPDYLKLNIPRSEFEQFKVAIKHNS